VAVRVISFPFRLGPTGSVATVEQGSDQEINEEIAVGMLTRPGERIQVPSFGVADPAFEGFVLGALQRHMIDFGPDVTVTEVSGNSLADGRQQVTVNWKPAAQPKGLPTQ
jgi:hypothetical protein